MLEFVSSDNIFNVPDNETEIEEVVGASPARRDLGVGLT